MRDSFYPTEPTPEKVKEIQELISDLRQKKGDRKKKLERFRSLTGFHKDFDEFIQLRPGIGEQALFNEVKYGKPPKEKNLTKEELIELVEYAFSSISEPALLHWYTMVLDTNVAMPMASDLLFFPPDHLDILTIDYEPDPEEVVERILAYQPYQA